MQTGTKGASKEKGDLGYVELDFLENKGIEVYKKKGKPEEGVNTACIIHSPCDVTEKPYMLAGCGKGYS